MPDIMVATCQCVRFLLPKHCNGKQDVEIVAEYEPLPKDNSIIVAHVYAEVGNCGIRGFLFAEHLSKKDIRKKGFITVVEKILDNPIFREKLQQYLNWGVEHGLVR